MKASRFSPISAVVLMSLLAGCGSSSASSDKTTTTSISQAATVTAVDSPPFKVRLSEPNFINDNARGLWFSYDVTIENTSDRKIVAEDTDKTSHGGLLSGNHLLVADSYCGAGSAGDGSLPTVACAAITTAQSIAVLEPHASAKFTTVDVYKGLNGMAPLVAGDYSWDRKVSWHYDGSQESETSDVQLTHHVK